MPFAATWMDLEIIILSEVSQRQIPYDITYMWNLKYNTNQRETKTDSQTQRTDLWLPRGKWSRGGKEWESEISEGKLPYIEWINKSFLSGFGIKVFLFS